MEPERWQQIERLFHRALECAPDERRGWLEAACAGDEELRREVESLLAEQARAGALFESEAVGELAAGWLQENATLKQEMGHFRLQGLLGRGGMGEVYLAEDSRLYRKVALKVLPEQFAGQEERLRRFKQEARAASALNHPNIVTIYEIGEAEGRHFIATEFIAGETLRDRLKREALSPATALDLALQVVSAHAAAHQAGIIHRDIKPENIMVREDGLVKVLDFGLAKLTRPHPADLDSPAATDGNVESTPGLVMGTVGYMSPEQVRGEPVDARTDIFSLGAVLYEMLAGQRAFQGKSQMAVLAAILDQEPAPLSAEIPHQLAGIIARCLHKEPAERYQSMMDLKMDLKAALEAARPESATPRQVLTTRQWSPQRVVWAALLAAVLLANGLLVWKWWQRPDAPVAPLHAEALTTLSGTEQSPSLSPQGDYLVFTWNGAKQNNQDIYVQQMLGQGEPLQRTNDPRDDYNPVWSPDGKWIAFLRSEPPTPTGLRHRELMLIPPVGGPEQKLADIESQDFFPVAAYLAWSADSSSLIVTDSPGAGQPDGLVVISLATREKKPLTLPRSPVIADTSPAVSPDGRSLVFLRRTTWGAGELHLLALGNDLTAAGEPRRLTSPDLRADFPAWMPDGNEIIFAARRSLWRLSLGGDNVPTRIPYVGEDGFMPVVSRPQPGKPARLVYARSFVDTNIWRLDTPAPGAPATSAPEMAIASTKLEYHCKFSPDGRRVVFSSNREDDAEIWVADADGANAVKLTAMQAFDTNCANWSPDGQHILFSSCGEGEFDLYVVPAAGGKPSRLTSHPAVDLACSFSQDGKWIYFTSQRSGDYRIWKMPANGGEALQVTSNQGSLAFETSDGRHLYYVAFSIPSPLWRLPTSGGEPIKVVDGVVWFNFCVLETGIYYIDQFNDETRLQYLNFATGKSTTVARKLGRVSSGLTATADGKTILFTRIDDYKDDLMVVENFQ